MLSEDNAAHPFGCDSPLQIVMVVWRPFYLKRHFEGHDFQANTRPRIFLKSQGHHKIQEDCCEEIQV
jgi:hypothetical protein